MAIVGVGRIVSRDPATPAMSYLADSGGLFLDMTVHDFDMASFVAGSPVLSVYAHGAVRVDQGYDRRVEVFGRLGMVASANVRLHATTISGADGTIAQPLQPGFIDHFADAYRLEWSAFVHYERDGGPSPVSDDQARHPIVIAAAASLSMAQNRPMTIVEIENSFTKDLA